MAAPADDTAALLRTATRGFDHIFSNEILAARAVFDSTNDSAFHALGLGVCAFLEAALGMEVSLVAEANRLLALAEAGAKKQAKATKASRSGARFPPGIEYELIHADTIILLGLTNAISESYMGYLQCLYALNNAHSKFSKIYKTVFPAGLDAYATPAASRRPSRKPSTVSLASQAPSTASTASSALPPAASPASASSVSLSSRATGFFGRWGSSLTASPRPATPVALAAPAVEGEDGPVEELIVSGAAFGYGLFNLVLSLLPGKVKSVVGFFGFDHDRKLALQALAVSAAKNDVHAVFAGLALMSYHGVVLLLSGYQANEAHIVKQYKIIVDKLEKRYPTGTLWILNQAKILRMTHDAEGAIRVLRGGLDPARPSVFVQADALLVFELAWTLLSQRRYEEAAEAFMRMTELNTWSHATYYFIAAGCRWSLRDLPAAQRLLDAIPALIDRKKIGGKDLPTEVLIKKKLVFYKAKRVRLTGSEAGYAQAITISPAEELGVFWNTHARIGKDVAEAHIREWLALAPPIPIDISTPYAASPLEPPADAPDAAPPPPALDTPDEHALRLLLLGIAHRTAGHLAPARALLLAAHALQPRVAVSTWVGGLAQFELAVLALREAEAGERAAGERMGAEGREDGEVDLSTRLDSRIMMLRDEIAAKREMLEM
ncbi:hypothetical protein HETIRDRAFT_471663 [Heterobasidion irregulare TC 32-1]|uniref:Mitochondrial outer membrane protein IML2 n=1 Tax=Heterobasidion irregulare (strain TC 32-1) TaxID=747525 RepID=W4KKE4_HETIT|nr:uncharacterized protein HETIRDRAFT_471663 [Heterobasidion irregulare TC 32-1]ETW86282.1 hypothetical protein HETIRDRAFT_471663 [Heterobasidion irregulare TC 32-1]